jgi:hypothetical protein
MKRGGWGCRALAALGLAVIAACGVATASDAAARHSKGLAGHFVGTAKLDGETKRAELDLVRTDFGLYRGGVTFKVSLDDPGVSCSAEGRDLGRGRVQILMDCEDGSGQEWRGTLTQGGKKLAGKIDGSEPTFTGSFNLHRGH